jgi:hypothetical protein
MSTSFTNGTTLEVDETYRQCIDVLLQLAIIFTVIRTVHAR